MVKKIFSILDSHQRSRVYILLVMILLGAVMETVGVSAILPLVSAVTDPTIIDTNKYFRYARDLTGVNDAKIFVLYMSLTLVVVYIIKNVYLIALNVAQNHFSMNNQSRISVRLMKCYLSQDYLFHSEHNVAELERNVSRDVSSFIYVVTNLLQLVTEVLVCLMLTVFLMITDIYTTSLMMLIMVIFVLFFFLVVRKKLRNYGEAARVYDGFIKRYFLEAFGGVKEVKATSSESFFAKRYEMAFDSYALVEQRRLTLTFIPRPLMESLCICGLLVFMSVRIALGADVNTFIPVMSVFAVAAIRMLPSFNRVSGYLGSIMFYKSSIDALYEDLKQVDELERQTTGDKKVDVDIRNEDIIVEGVTFAYPSKQDRIIIDKASITIPKNKSVAFIGPSGAGKTTLADLILGILEPQKGTVTVGGVDVIANKDSWHKKIGYIPQATFLTDDTIRNNVAFGIPEDEIDDDKIWNALEMAQISEFVKNQPEGIHSNIGDRGVKISGGQKQRIGIARALYNNPDVIVLDEATSALDNDTEQAVMDAIYNLSGKKTMIIIAHRLTTIKNCDIIYEVKDGKIRQVDYDEIR